MDGHDGDPYRRIYLAGGRDGGWASRLGSGPADLGPDEAARAPGARSRCWAWCVLVVQVVGSACRRAATSRRPGRWTASPTCCSCSARWPGSSCAAGRSSSAAVAVAAAATYLGLGYPMGPVVAERRSVAARRRGPRTASRGLGHRRGRATPGCSRSGQVSGHPVSLGRAVAFAAWLVLLLVVGEAPRYRAEQFAAARRARAAETRVAASAERLALARDLHDTIGHSLSMIAVQAGVALHLLDEHPEQARPALTAIRTASKEALEEVRATLSILREEDFEGRPAPGLARVGDLVAAARIGGLVVQISPDPLGDSVSGLPDDVDAAAFRVVQEGLTNVARHSAAANATVAVVRSASTLEVSVVDDGLGTDQVVEGGGLRGMRERAAALGGQVEAGPVDGGGFRVAVRFPLDNRSVSP